MTDATSDVSNLPAPEAAALDEGLFAEFVGPRHEVYQHTLEKMRRKDPQLRKIAITWCWPAFLVPIAWLMYRKLYGFAMVIIGIPVVLALVFPALSSTGSSGITVMIAMMGKSIYVQHALRRIEKLRGRAGTSEELHALVRKAGGVSTVGAVIGTILTIGFTILAFMAAFAKHR